MITILMTCCYAGNTLEWLLRPERELCSTTYAICCTLGGTDDTCCKPYKCCPWSTCASLIGR